MKILFEQQCSIVLTRMNTAQAILFIFLICSVSSQICDEPGICGHSLLLTTVPANDSFDCMDICRSYDGCNYGSFCPDNYYPLCLLFQTCSKLDTTFHRNCKTSSIECAQCNIPGICVVSTLGIKKNLKIG